MWSQESKRQEERQGGAGSQNRLCFQCSYHYGKEFWVRVRHRPPSCPTWGWGSWGRPATLHLCINTPFIQSICCYWRHSMWAVPSSLTLPMCCEFFQAEQAPEARENHQTRKAGAGKSPEHSNSFWLSCLSYVDSVATPSDFKTSGNVGFSMLLQILYTQKAFS